METVFYFTVSHRGSISETRKLPFKKNCAFLHLHSRHTADAGKHGGKDGEFHGAGDVKTKEKTCENLSTFAGFWS